jgi:hypothetical protein
MKCGAGFLFIGTAKEQQLGANEKKHPQNYKDTT